MKSTITQKTLLARALALLTCGLLATGLVGCGADGASSSEDAVKSESAACEEGAPAAYWYPVSAILDPTYVSKADAEVREAFEKTVDQRPRVGLDLSKQGSASADRWIVLRSTKKSKFFGGLAPNGQVSRWFNSARADGDWKKLRLSPCEMLRVVKNGQSGPVDAASAGSGSNSKALKLTIRKPFVGCDYEAPKVETLETSSSVTVTAKFLYRNPDEDVVCAAVGQRERNSTARVTLLKPIGDRDIFDGSVVPKRLVATEK